MRNWLVVVSRHVTKALAPTCERHFHRQAPEGSR
jgi:hypothetical protein